MGFVCLFRDRGLLAAYSKALNRQQSQQQQSFPLSASNQTDMLLQTPGSLIASPIKQMMDTTPSSMTLPKPSTPPPPPPSFDMRSPMVSNVTLPTAPSSYSTAAGIAAPGGGGINLDRFSSTSPTSLLSSTIFSSDFDAASASSFMSSSMRVWIDTLKSQSILEELVQLPEVSLHFPTSQDIPAELEAWALECRSDGVGGRFEPPNNNHSIISIP